MELSEEEKQAIKRIKFLIKEIKCQCDICKLNVVTFKIILNLINKQQKEIEELKENFVSKDKIREKIKELETLYNCNLDTALTSYEMFVFVQSYIDKVKNILNELLEDN